MTEFILDCHILAPRYLLVRIKIATREASSQQTLGLKENHHIDEVGKLSQFMPLPARNGLHVCLNPYSVCL